MLNVCNIGSCFAGSVAHCITRIAGTHFSRISSVQHTRIDQFNNQFIRNTVEPLHQADIDFNVKDQFQNVVDNQCLDANLGCSLPYGMDPSKFLRPPEALKLTDIYLIDNFADLLFRGYKNPKTGKQLYVHKDHLDENSGSYSEEIDRLPPEVAMKEYILLFQEVKRRYNPKAKAIFLNFPINDDKRASLIERTYDFSKMSQTLWDEKDFGVIDLIGMPKRDLVNANDTFHFVWGRYYQYSFQVMGLLNSLGEGFKFSQFGE